MHKFEEQFKAIEAMPDNEKKEDEIPKSLRKEFQIPENIDKFDLDFDYIRKTDYSKKKFRPIWSGQDVIPDVLNFEKSLIAVGSINSIRVWPTGFAGILKRIRFVLRLFESHNNLFDTSMTFAVLLNTVVPSMFYYGIEEELENLLNLCNT